MAATPKINRGRLTMVRDEHVKAEVDGGEGVVVEGGVEEGRAHSQQRSVEGPDILESRFDVVEGGGADKGFVGESTTAEGNH